MNDSNKTMIVIFHGYAMKTSQYNSLVKTITTAIPNSIIIVPKMPLSIFSCADPNKIVNDILNQIQNKWENLADSVQKSLKIIFIGHSTGALIARKLYIVACGENQDAPIEKEINATSTRVWAKNVERIILFAGINKGWTLTTNLSIWESILYKSLIIVGKIISLFRQPIAFKTKRGNPFITQLRIQALSMYKQAHIKSVGNALMIQLLGTQDSVVSPDDNIDLVADQNFIYLEIPVSDHLNVINMMGKDGEKRKKIVIETLTYNREQLQEREIIPSDQIIISPNPKITDVVFVIHGIRDTGYWTQKIARRVKSIGDKIQDKEFAIETSSYGYFPMLSFLLYPFRQNKVQWFMDQYVENLALYPNAKFSFIGHSNGTYLLAKALTDYPAAKFKNIVLAGSVVKQNYNWRKLMDEKQVENIYNFIATNDWIVGIFPKTFQTFGIQDLGSGGYDGFTCLEDETQFKCISGGHGAAIEESTWDEIAYLTIYGKPSSDNSLSKKERSFQMKLIVSIGPILFALCFLAIFYIGYEVYNITYSQPNRFIYMSIYLVAIWKTLTKL
jgi:flavodoxin